MENEKFSFINVHDNDKEYFKERFFIAMRQKELDWFSKQLKEKAIINICIGENENGCETNPFVSIEKGKECKIMPIRIIKEDDKNGK